MSEPRKYTVAEIDQMRRAIEWSYPSGVAYYAKDREANVEDRLRTYMQNGTDPAELQSAVNAQIVARQQHQQAKDGLYTASLTPRALCAHIGERTAN